MHTPEINKYRSKRYDIQALRAIAVLSVLLFHFTSFFKSGYLGVDMFFVISGYVIFPRILEIINGKNTSDRKHLILKFYKKRFLRLYPALAVNLLIFNFLLIFLTNSEEHKRILNQALLSLIGFANFGAYFNSGNYFSPNINPYLHLWSLSIEMQIYFLVPLFFLLFNVPKKYFRKITSIISIVSLILFVYTPINHAIFQVIGLNDHFHNLDYYLLSNRFFEFGFGGILALIKTNKNKRIVFNFTINLILLVILIFEIQIKFLPTVLVVLFTGLALYFRSFESNSKAIKALFVWVGDRSYSIYLIHLPVFYILKYSPISPFDSNLEIIFFSFLSTFVFGSLSYRFIEEKFRKIKNIRLEHTKKFLGFLVMPLIITLLLTVFIHKNYFGLLKVTSKPIASWDIDKVCGTNILPAPCKFINNPGSNSILLVGDSHAAQISQTLKRVAKDLNYNLFVWSHCDFQVTDSGNMQEPSCLTNNLRILDFMEKEKPDFVVISQRMHSKTPKLDVLSGVSAALKSGAHVIFVGNNPVFPDGAKYFTNVLIGKYNPSKYMKLAEMDKDSISAARKFEFLSKTPQVAYIDTLALICENKLCARYKNGNWLYWDSGHLSIYGANLIERNLRSTIIKNGQ
jgi:peptidoglycan/LPS O-acetylase OafA/YrhL